MSQPSFRPQPDPDPGVQINYQARELTMHYVTEEELTTLRGVGPTICVAFLGLTAGCAFSLWTALKSTGLSVDTQRDFESLLVAALVLSGFFGLLAIFGYVRLVAVIRKVKRRGITQ